MCASMRCSSWWWIGRRCRSSFMVLKAASISTRPPQLGRVFAGEIGAQQIATFAPADLAQPGAIEREAEGSALLRHHNIDQTPGRRSLGARGAELHEQFLAVEIHGGDLFEARP